MLNRLHLRGATYAVEEAMATNLPEIDAIVKKKVT